MVETLLSHGDTNTLEQLRKVDGLIDISKSTLQLDIILALNANNELSPAEIASVIGQRRKAVTDALRKLRNKGLVDTTLEGGKSARYVLTDSGAECISVINRCIGNNGHGKANNIIINQVKKIPSVNATSIQFASALSQLLFALGTAKGNALPLSEIASIMGLSEQRTESYLELFMKSEPRLFRRYTDDPSWVKHLRKLGLKLRTKKRETFYGLTQEGLQYFYKLPSYNRIRRSKSYKMLSTLTRSNSPREIVKKLGFAVLLVSVFSFVTTFMVLDLQWMLIIDILMVAIGILLSLDIFKDNI
ncbi:MAG: MarR family transcriptional regulator [Candidatus Methanosuratus sp.]|nr:MarR family transcriptional regulator [Candidatus Methanosuratincola sp.]